MEDLPLHLVAALRPRKCEATPSRHVWRSGERAFSREAWRLKDFESFECSAIASLFSKPMQKVAFRHRSNISLLQQT